MEYNLELKNKIGKNLLSLVTNKFSSSKCFKTHNTLVLLFELLLREILFKN